MSDSRYKLTKTEDRTGISAMKTTNFPSSNAREFIKRHQNLFGQGFGIIMFNLGILIMLVGIDKCCGSIKHEITDLSITDQSIKAQPDPSIPVEWIPKATIPDLYYQQNSNPDYCNDFYGTVCNSTVGKRMEFTNPEDDYLHHTARKQFRKELGMLLVEPLTPTEPQSAQDAKSFYRFCMNEESIDKRGLDSVKNFLNGLGGWPNLNAAWLKEHTWSKLLPQMKKMGYMGHDFFAVQVVPDPEKDKYVIQITPATWTWEMDEFLKSKEMYLKNIIDVMEVLGYNSTRFVYKGSSDLELLQGGFNNTNESKRVKETSIDELNQNYTNIDWKKFIQDFFPENFVLNKTDKMSLVYSEHAVGAAKKFNLSTDGMKPVDYLIWRFLAELKDFLPKELRHKLWWNDSNDPYKPDRWENCVREVSIAFPKTSAAMYIKRHRNPEVEFRVEEIFQRLKTVFEDTFRKMKWLDEASRNNKSYGLRNIHLYEDVNHIKDPEINYSEENFEVVEDDPLQTILNLRKRVIKHDYSRLNKPFNKDDRWLKKVENDLLFPRYLEDRNQLYLPTRFVQTVLFNPEREDFINYAVFGSMIAREIARTIFRDTSTTDYQSIKECFDNQYWNKFVPEILNDYMGFRTAYLAYANLLNSTAESKTGTPKSKLRESFWGNAGFSLCSEYTNTSKQHFGYQVPHGSPQIRLDFFSYLQEFRDDFNCRLTTLPNCSLIR